MTYTYAVVVVGPNELHCIHRTDAGGNTVSIPTDPANSDYQAYLRWLENPNAELTPPKL